MLYHKKPQGQPLAACSRYPWARKLPNLCDIISSIQKDFFLVGLGTAGDMLGHLRGGGSCSMAATATPPPPHIVSNIC